MTDKEKAARNAYLKRKRRESSRLVAQVEAVMDKQLKRIQARFAKTDNRLNQERQRVGLAEMEAGLELRRHIGSGGYAGAKRPSLSQLEGDTGDRH